MTYATIADLPVSTIKDEEFVVVGTGDVLKKVPSEEVYHNPEKPFHIGSRCLNIGETSLPIGDFKGVLIYTDVDIADTTKQHSFELKGVGFGDEVDIEINPIFGLINMSITIYYRGSRWYCSAYVTGSRKKNLGLYSPTPTAYFYESKGKIVLGVQLNKLTENYEALISVNYLGSSNVENSAVFTPITEVFTTSNTFLDKYGLDHINRYSARIQKPLTDDITAESINAVEEKSDNWAISKGENYLLLKVDSRGSSWNLDLFGDDTPLLVPLGKLHIYGGYNSITNEFGKFGYTYTGSLEDLKVRFVHVVNKNNPNTKAFFIVIETSHKNDVLVNYTDMYGHPIFPSSSAEFHNLYSVLGEFDPNNIDNSSFPNNVIAKSFKTRQPDGSLTELVKSVNGQVGDVVIDTDILGITRKNQAVAVGYQAGQKNQGNRAVAIGGVTGIEHQGENAVAIGNSTAYINQGDNAVAVGCQAGRQHQGIYAVAVGYQSGYSSQGGSSIAIGYKAGLNLMPENSIAIGSDSSCTGEYQFQLGGTGVTTYAYGAVQERTDARDLADIEPLALGLDFVNLLQPKTFRMDYREDYRAEPVERVIEVSVERPVTSIDSKGNMIETVETVIEEQTVYDFDTRPLSELPKDGSKKRNRLHIGVLPQDVKTAMETLNVDFGLFQDHKVKGGEDSLSIGYTQLIPVLIKAIQELSVEVAELKEGK